MVSLLNITESLSNNIPNLSRLQLLDYLYFMIYTITTTGYGDIIPVSGFTKFIVSIANILEVFFLVIFFNALLSVRSESSHGDSTSSRQSGQALSPES